MTTVMMTLMMTMTEAGFTVAGEEHAICPVIIIVMMTMTMMTMIMTDD